MRTVDSHDRVRRLAGPLAAERALELVDVEVAGAGARTLVRVVVDRKGGVDLGACEELSRALSDALDRDDPIAGRYRLEVTSPGVDRPLRDRAAFDRVEGRDVLVHRGDASAPTQLRGRVLRAEDDAVVLEVDGSPVRVPYDEVVTAKQTLPW